MILTKEIEGRQAFPIRAIPFAAGSESFTRRRYCPPSLIIESAMQFCDAWPPGLPPLRLYCFDGKSNTVPVTSNYLDVAAPIVNFQPENDEPLGESIKRLPPGLFAYADELESFIRWIYPEGIRVDGVFLNDESDLPKDIADLIFEGFQGAGSGTQTTEEIMLKSAFVTKFKNIWPSIERDLRDASRKTSGLSKVAKHENHGYWKIGPALNWARQRGKITVDSAKQFIKQEGDNELSVMIRQLFNL